MNKNTQNTKISYNVVIINALAAKYDFTPRYIRQILQGDRTPVFADRIKADYQESEKKMKEILNDQKL